MSARRIRETVLRVASALVRPLWGGLGCIVTLHRVVPATDRSALPSNHALEITPEDLRATLAWVRSQGIDAIPLDQVPERLRAPRAPRFISFTFDDGYRDNLTFALPIFREFGVPFAVNITNGFIAGTASVWWYFLEEALATGKPLQFSWHGTEHHFSASNAVEQNQALDQISGWIRSEGMARDELIRVIAEAVGIDPCAATRRLCFTWDELRELAADPLVTIGAHTARHHSLNRLTEAEIVEEVETARRDLAAQLAREVRHFAYPFGGPNAADEREFAIVRRGEFATMLTTRAANLTPAHAAQCDRLPRLTISGNYPALQSLRMAESGLAAWRQRRARR